MVRNLTEYNHAYYLTHKEQINAKDKEEYWQNRDKALLRQRKYRKAHKVVLKNKKHEWYERRKKDIRQRDRLLRLRVLEKLGGKCAKCGFSDLRALQVDHVQNNGYEERKQLHWRKYYKIILNLTDEELKRNYQLLCANCNWIRKYDEGL